jgi:hypothetical protein
MPPKSKRGGAAAARKAPVTRGRMGRAQAAAEAAPVVEEMEAPAEEVKAAEEVPKVVEAPKVVEDSKVVEEPKPSPLLPQQPVVVVEKDSDIAANGANQGEGIVSAPISCIGRDFCCGLACSLIDLDS